MRTSSPLQGVFGWFLRRIIRSYWSLPLLAVLAAPVFALIILWADREFLTAWIIAEGLTPVATADTARDFAGVVSGINAAFISLYFSITLIVLSLAAGNLGVRLIDRWLGKRLIRVSISGLGFSLIVSLIAMLAIDPDSAIEQVPLGLLSATFLLELVNIAMLAVSLHDLGRTMFVDTSLARLSRDARAMPVPITAATQEPDIAWGSVFAAQREGYVEGNDLSRIARILAVHPGRARVCKAPGQHVMCGEPLILLENPLDRERELLACIPVGPYRSDSQGLVFQIRLLVEIAARALSPAVNDFYTALVAADHLAVAMSNHASLWVDEGEIAVYEQAPRIELPGQDFCGLFEDPLAAFRQAAADYPSVSIRMIDNYARICERMRQHGGPQGLTDFCKERARDLRDHAVNRAQLPADAQDIERAFARLCANLAAGNR